MTKPGPARQVLADLLNAQHDDRWIHRWDRAGNMAHALRTLDMAMTLLDGHEPVYADLSFSTSGEGETFDLVVMADDRLVRVQGAIDQGWPPATVMPRRELQRLELRETPHEPASVLHQWSGQSAVTLEYPGLRVDLPMSYSEARGAKLAELVPSLIADRMASAARV